MSNVLKKYIMLSTKLNVHVYFMCGMFTNMNLILDLRGMNNKRVHYILYVID